VGNIGLSSTWLKNLGLYNQGVHQRSKYLLFKDNSALALRLTSLLSYRYWELFPRNKAAKT
jgi:hypothetical protein